MTEFGSDRYLEKFNQSQSPPTPTVAPGAGVSQSQFILPLRGSNLSEPESAPLPKTAEQKRSDRKGFGFLRNKFHVKTSLATAPSSTQPAEQRPSSTHSTTTPKPRLVVALSSAQRCLRS